MTWLSRLLPQSPTLRLADHNVKRRTRQAQRRRRMSTLESLEGRTLLSNITASQNAANVVSIVGDTHGDQFSVTVNKDNTVTVVGTDAKTQVNSHAVGVAWPWWDVLLFGVTALAGAGAYTMATLEKPRAT